MLTKKQKAEIETKYNEAKTPHDNIYKLLIKYKTELEVLLNNTNNEIKYWKNKIDEYEKNND